jgi:hypothetical protein
LALTETCGKCACGEMIGKKAMQIDLADANEKIDMLAHERTYHHFTKFVKYSIATIAILLIGMAIFLT